MREPPAATGPIESIQPLDGHLFGAGQPCFGCSPDHPHGFRLRFERRDGAIVTRFTPGTHHQGPPGMMHGGLVATLADEVAAWTVIGGLGKFGFTASFDGRLHRPVRIGVPLEGIGTIVDPTRRLIDVDVRIVQEAQDTFTGRFRFVLVDRAGAERVLGGPIPAAWDRFCK
jgi:acyl-coenzyme A thioesterase PaaI-like protein